MPSAVHIPKTQTAALIREIGGDIEFQTDYPVPVPAQNEVLAQVLYSGVCHSDLHTKAGTAVGADGYPISGNKLPHVGGHEGVGRIVSLGPGCAEHIKIGDLVGIRFASRICRQCEFCLAGKEQYCTNSTNHLFHEDGSFQEYIALDADYLTILPRDIDPKVMGPVLCAGVTTYNAVANANIQKGQWLAVVGAGGGLGHLAVQYAKARGARVIGIDGGPQKRDFVLRVGAEEYVDFTSTDPIKKVLEITGIGAQAVVVTAGNAQAYAHACEMLRVGGTLSCVGIPSGRPFIQTPVSSIVIKGLKIVGSMIGSLKDCMEAVELVRQGIVKPEISVREFKELPQVYEEMHKGDIAGRIVLKIAA